MSSSTSPALPPFSYAQAARGFTPTNQNAAKSLEPSLIVSEQNAPDTRPVTAEPGKLDLASPKAEKARGSSTGSEVTIDQQQAVLNHGIPNKENVPPSNGAGSSNETTKPLTSVSISPSRAAEVSSELPKAESSDLPQAEASESWDKQSEVSTYVEKSTEISDKPKKDIEDDWERISASAVSGQRELRPAPPPTVNFWLQRKADQEAKAKDSPAPHRLTAPTPAPAASKPKTQGSGPIDETKRKPTEKNQSSGDKDGTGSRRKQETGRASEGARRDQTETSGTRPGSQHKENAKATAPPPVGDAKLWPTPETAISEERRKSMTVEKSDKPDNKTNGPKSHTKQWTHVPYVPSVVFETQLPPAAARRGGRPSNRGREGSGRGAFNNNSNANAEKNDSTNMPPPPLPQERGRRGADSTRGARAASVPTQGRRSSSANGMVGESRKVSETPGRNVTGSSQAKLAAIETSTTNTNTRDSTTPSTQDNRSVSRPAITSPAATSTTTIDLSGKPHESTNDTHAHPAPENDLGANTAAWLKDVPFQSQRNSTEFSNKAKMDPTSRTVRAESWREPHPQMDQNGRRGESRTERGRGGGRGRAAHYSAQPIVHPSYTAPLTQGAFSGAKQTSFNRPPPQSFQMGQSSNGNRNGQQTQAIRANTMFSHYPSGMVGMNQPLSPIQTDMQMYGYPQMHPGVMSAVPYSSPLESMALLSMVSVQVEYYFSIDNLCKDMWLRRHMDSQGWVPISVIANFKRIRALTEDMHALRSVCSQLKGVEFWPGENGEEDRLRSREKWSEFILDAKDRLPEARPDGPSEAQVSPRPASNGYSNFTDPYFANAGQMRSPSWSQAAFTPTAAPIVSPTAQSMPPQLDGMMSETPMSATILDFYAADGSHENARSPSVNAVNGFGAPGLANGYHNHPIIAQEEAEDVFPNERIAVLSVVSRKFNDMSTSQQPPFISNSTRTFSHGSIDGSTDIRGAEMPTLSAVSGLRGGAGSPEQLERLQMPQSSFLRRSSQIDAPPILWVKDGAPPVALHQDGMNHELYLSVRDRALQQRVPGHSTEDMDLLYQFWSHFLVRNFNVGMYTEFHSLALQDLQNSQDSGAKHLVRYYEALLTSQTPLSDRLAQDIVAMAANEPGESRLAFQKLRTAWRNGAFSMKSRTKINKILPSSLRAELEK